MPRTNPTATMPYLHAACYSFQQVPIERFRTITLSYNFLTLIFPPTQSFQLERDKEQSYTTRVIATIKATEAIAAVKV